MTATANAVDPRIVAEFQARVGFSLTPSLGLLAYMGSHSHGTYVPPTDPDAIDDVDLMGVVIPPPSQVVGIHDWEHCCFKVDELDVVIYSARKFFRLLLKSNPNVLGLLWLRDEDYLIRAPWATEVLARREVFSSLRAYHAFIGYAHGQLQRMDHYNQAADEEYGRLLNTLEAADINLQAVLEADPNKLDHLAGGHDTERHRLLSRFRQLHKRHFSGYMGVKRKRLVREHGYDCKNAAHLLRLMRMCNEFLDTGVLHVYRTHDADELRAVKRGDWTIEQVKAEANRLFEEARLKRDASHLPADPDEHYVNQLAVAIHLRAYAGENRHLPAIP